MRFVNDPKFDAVPLVGGDGESMAVVDRTRGGNAVRWVPGGDVAALCSFLKGAMETAVVDGVLYERVGDNLRKMDLSRPYVVIRPAAGDVMWVANVAAFAGQYATVELEPKDQKPHAVSPKASPSYTPNEAFDGELTVTTGPTKKLPVKKAAAKAVA